jgi:hypothetical protein
MVKPRLRFRRSILPTIPVTSLRLVCGFLALAGTVVRLRFLVLPFDERSELLGEFYHRFGRQFEIDREQNGQAQAFHLEFDVIPDFPAWDHVANPSVATPAVAWPLAPPSGWNRERVAEKLFLFFLRKRLAVARQADFLRRLAAAAFSEWLCAECADTKSIG